MIFFYIISRHELKNQSRCVVIYKRTKKYYLNQIGPVPVTLAWLEKSRQDQGSYCIVLTRIAMAFAHVYKTFPLRGVKYGDCSLWVSRDKMPYLFSIVIYKIMNLFYSWPSSLDSAMLNRGMSISMRGKMKD